MRSANYEMSLQMRKYNLILLFLACLVSAQNIISEWGNLPNQHLVTKHSPPPSLDPPPLQQSSLNYEDIVVFALKASIAAFHIDHKTFITDRERLTQYFDKSALDQINQALLPGTGSGFLDTCILKQTPCDAITRSPVVIEQDAPHYLQVRLPMVLTDGRNIDTILSISKQMNQLRIQNFSIEIPYEQR